MFNNHNPITNGEKSFYEQHKEKFDVIWDVGCRSDSLFTDFTGEVHYFEPCKEQFRILLSSNTMCNSRYFLNPFGLSDEDRRLVPYYPVYQSFIHRTSCGNSEEKVELEVRRADRYIQENTIDRIDFVKIDTEGYEFRVLKGFGEKLAIVKTIQFEYGGTFIDSHTTLKEVITYLESMGFTGFSYLCPEGTVPIPDYDDHYQYCNIVCWNQR